MTEPLVGNRQSLFIGGHWLPPISGGEIAVISPSTERVVARVGEGRREDALRAVDAAADAWCRGDWAAAAPAERAAVLEEAATHITSRSQEIAHLLTSETGIPVSLASSLGPAHEGILTATAALSGSYPFQEPCAGLHTSATIIREPVGIVAAIIPWNGPLYLALQKVAPALLAGCSVVLKLPPEAPLSGFVLADALESAGLPEGVLSVLPGGADVGRALVADRRVAKVSFTGSTAVGQDILRTAAESVQRTTLELGGKSAAIIMDDADLYAAAAHLTAGMTMMSGQSCGLLSRVLVPAARRSELIDYLSELLRRRRVGDPFDHETEMGPLISARQRSKVEEYVALGQREGAKLVTGGGRPAHLDTGWFVEATLFAEVDNSMRIAREEIFGPVICAIEYGSDDEAIAIANDSDYGLGAAVFSSDLDRARRAAGKLRAGTVAVNCYGTDPAIPTGGFGMSGLGRERGRAGLDEYVELKAIYGCG